MKRILLLIATFGLFGFLVAQENTWEVYLSGQAVKSVEFENSNVWAVTDNFLVKINKMDKSVIYYSYPDNVNDMTGLLKIDKKGVKWIVRSEPGLNPVVNSIYSFDGNTWDKTVFSGAGPIYSLAVDKDNKIWITADAFSGHLYKLEQGSFLQYTPENSGLIYNSVYKVTSDKNGDIWLANSGNFGDLVAADIEYMKFDGETWTSYLSERSFAFNYVTCDYQGNPWVQNPMFVRKLDTNSNSWSEQITLGLDLPYYLYAIEGENKFWFKSKRDNGMASYNGSDWIYYTASNSGLPSDIIYDIQIDSEGTKWIGTANGLAAFNLTTSNTRISKLNPEFELFPNPAKDLIILKIPNELQNSIVDILTIHGKVMKSLNIENDENRLDISYFPAGVYLVRIQSNENYIVKKFVKQ